MPWWKFWAKDRRPSPRRVAARALALASAVGRADLERDLADGDHDLEQNEQARHRSVWKQRIKIRVPSGTAQQ